MFWDKNFVFKKNDWLGMVAELRVQYFIIEYHGSFDTFQTNFPSIIATQLIANSLFKSWTILEV